MLCSTNCTPNIRNMLILNIVTKLNIIIIKYKLNNIGNNI